MGLKFSILLFAGSLGYIVKMDITVLDVFFDHTTLQGD